MMQKKLFDSLQLPSTLPEHMKFNLKDIPASQRAILAALALALAAIVILRFIDRGGSVTHGHTKVEVPAQTHSTQVTVK